MPKRTPDNWQSNPTGIKLNERLATVERRKRMEAARWSLAPDVRNQVEKIHQFGPRAVLEFLAEIGNRNHCVEDIRKRLAAWSAFAPETVQAVGGDRFVPWRPLVVPGDL